MLPGGCGVREGVEMATTAAEHLESQNYPAPSRMLGWWGRGMCSGPLPASRQAGLSLLTLCIHHQGKVGLGSRALRLV